jgi:predicted MPP superfamily phosphohydrolase
MYYWRKGIRNWQVKFSVFASFAIFLVYIYATWLEPQRLQIHSIILKSPKINSKIKLLHISDIQAASIGSYENYIFEQIEALQPDIIIHTGDLIQPANYGADYDTELDKLSNLFKKLKVSGGIYHVIGDTDPESKMEDFAKKTGISYLFNDNTTIKIKEQNISIVGLSLEKSRIPNRIFMQEITQKTQPNFTIIAGHAPDYMLALQNVSSDLCLAGHTHGGQIKLPFWGALVTFSAIPREKASGYFLQDKIPCNISAGIGAEHAAGLPSIRFNCPPEMTLFILEGN